MSPVPVHKAPEVLESDALLGPPASEPDRSSGSRVRRAMRCGVFVGLWPPMFWLIGDSLERHE